MVEISNQYYTTISFGVFISTLLLLHQLSTNVSSNHKKVFEDVLKDFSLEEYKPVIEVSGCTTVVEFVNFWSNEESLKNIPIESRHILKGKSEEIKHHFILRRWLQKHDLLDIEKVKGQEISFRGQEIVFNKSGRHRVNVGCKADALVGKFGNHNSVIVACVTKKMY